MRIALIDGTTGADFPPLGALTLASLAKAAGAVVDLVSLPGPAERTAVARRLRNHDLVAFSTNCGAYPNALLLARTLKTIHRRLPIVFGGPQATVTAAATVTAFPEVDVVVGGEAERSWPALLAGLTAGREDWRCVPGATWIQNGAVQSLPEADLLADLDAVPLPDYAAFPGTARGGTVPLEVGRGCPYGCTFCSTNTFFKRRFRMKSAGRIIADVTALARQFGARHVDFIHDMFTVRRDLVVEIAGAMARLPVGWNCSARTDRLDDDLIRTIAASGCRGVYVGLEAGSRRLQRSLRKNLDVEAAMAVVRRCQAEGMGVTASLIVGYPIETRADLRETLLCAFELARPHPSHDAQGPIRIQLPFFAPMPATPILAESGPLGFDGIIPSAVEIGSDTALEPDAVSMIMAHPDIFCAFLHAEDTEVARADYIVLMQVLTALTDDPPLMAWLAAREGPRFVDHLLTPGLGRHRRPDQRATLEAVLAAYQDRPRRHPAPARPVPGPVPVLVSAAA